MSLLPVLQSNTYHLESYLLQLLPFYSNFLSLYSPIHFPHCCCSSVAQPYPTLQFHELQHARLPSPLLSAGVCSNKSTESVDMKVLEPCEKAQTSLLEGGMPQGGRCHLTARADLSTRVHKGQQAVQPQSHQMTAAM